MTTIKPPATTIEEDGLKFSKDPGIAKYGNFINYYSFNSAEERIKLLPNHIWPKSQAEEEEIQTATTITTSNTKKNKLFVLDIGCNAGNFTQLLYEFLGKHYSNDKDIQILGIDLDQLLINRANEHNQFPNNITYKCLDIMRDDDAADRNFINSYLNKHEQLKFDIVFCLSLTMWIHLNNGDDGLLKFLDLVSNVSRMIVIEPQPWKCYLTAVKRLKRANKEFERFNQLKLRNTIENDICKYLTDNCNVKKIFETIPTKWNRKISFYTKNNDEKSLIV